MTSNASMAAPESTESLLKKLATLISQNNHALSESVYRTMRDTIRQRPSVKPAKGYSHYDEMLRNQDLEEFIANRGRIKQYLESVDSHAAQKFTSLVDKVQHDKTLILAERISSLNFLMEISRRRSNSDLLVLSKQEKNPLKLNTNKLTNGILSSREIGVVVAKESPKLPPSELKCSRSTESICNSDSAGSGLSEWDVFEGITFAWQGVSSRIFRKLSSKKYVLDEKLEISPWLREHANKLANLGFLHDTLKSFVEDKCNEGIVRNSFITFVRDQLTEYYGLIAAIRTEFQREVEAVRKGGDFRQCRLSLAELRLLIGPAEMNFQNLLSILKFTENDRGGFLASGVFSFFQQGDSELKKQVHNILAEICRPIWAMLITWLLDGELCDPKHEFFIAVNDNVDVDRLWHDKYSLRMPMLPEFISVSLAEKILSVGRSINFLKESCGDEKPYADREKMKELLESTSVEVFYLMEKEEELESLINKAYDETNRRVLSVLIDKYKMLDHFQAHRKYLLLGQGDFINHLMDLLLEMLDGPSSKLHPHVLNSLLDSAIRTTSAQYESEEILSRLDAHMLTSRSREDIGWNVFYLQYHVDGPIGTVFHTAARTQYRTLFYALWQAKRMEVVLSRSWLKGVQAAKLFREMPEMGPILRQCNELIQEMVHFVLQIQYYFLFEVLECSWNELVEEIHRAESLDHVIAAHQQFLHNVSIGVFKDESREMLASQLRIAYDFVLKLKETIDLIVRDASKELQTRIIVDHDPLVKKDNSKRLGEFQKNLQSAEQKIKLIASPYRNIVKKFLLTLHNEHDDPYLQLLSVRLDFNEYYKNLDARLGAPLTYQHRRLSSIGGESSPALSRKLQSPLLSRKEKHDKLMYQKN